MQSASTPAIAQQKKYNLGTVLACVAAILLIIYSITSSLIEFSNTVNPNNPSANSSEYVWLLLYIITFMLLTLGCVIGTALKSRVASILLFIAIAGHLAYNIYMNNGVVSFVLDGVVLALCAYGVFSMFKWHQLKQQAV